MKLENRKQKTVNGFTLVETLIAIGILTIAASAPLFSASRAVTFARSSSYQMTASYLAQEGIEYVRAVRDDAFLTAYHDVGSTASDEGWNSFSSSINQCRDPQMCVLDPTDGLSQCSGSSCTLLWLDDTNHIYRQTQTTGQATVFYRTIQTQSVTLKDEKVISKVTWTYHGTPYSVTVIDHLTPWQ